MAKSQIALLVAMLALLASSNPVVDPLITNVPKLEERATTCTFSGSGGASSASVSQKSCATIVLENLVVPSGVTLDLGSLNDGTHVIFEGQTSWGYKEWEGPLLQIKGKSITVEGASGAYLNPDGARWWDGQGSNGGKTKPKFFYAHSLSSSSIKNLHIQNTPVQAVSVNGCQGLTITNMTIDNRAGDSQRGANTDGFDIGSSSDVTISGANVYNQDDCVAVNSGMRITFSGGVCSGGHGLSIGSVGGRSDNTVQNVIFSNSEVKNSANGIRIKATAGDTGEISGVSYNGITLQNITKYGVLIEQNYNGGDLHGSPTGGIPITGLTVENIAGSGGVSSTANNIAIVCGSGACSNWHWSNVQVSGGKKYGGCQNVPNGISC